MATEIHARPKSRGVRHDGDGSVAERREARTSTEASLARMPLVSQHYENSKIGDQARVHFGNQYGDQHHYHYATKDGVPGVSISKGDLMKQFLESLAFPQMNYRFMTIKPPSPQTCSWFLTTPQYTKWRNKQLRHNHHGLLWLNGKPGSGKSTIAKFVLGHAKRVYTDEKSLYFFFNGRGAGLEKSVVGMFRSLLHQLAHHVPRLTRIVPPQAVKAYGTEGWPLELLTTLFRESIHRLAQEHQVTCYIDALDEGEDEDHIRDMVSFLEDIIEAEVANDSRFSIFLSSRHYPHISVAFSVRLILDDEEHHHRDIANYVRSKLKCKQESLSKELVTDISKRASGVFLWVVLTVKVLNKECDQGNRQSSKSQLDAIPKNLSQLYNSIIHGGATDERFLPIIQWVMCAQRLLRPEELYFAVLTATDSLSTSSVIWNQRATDNTMIRDFILSSSKGLLEIVSGPQSKHSSVQFIHESVREYLVSAGIHQLNPTMQGNVIGGTHILLAQWCGSYLDLASQCDVRHDFDIALSGKLMNKIAHDLEVATLSAVLPFLTYALDEVLQHSESAACCGTIVPMDFEQTIHSPLWLSWKGILPMINTRLPPVLHILTHECCINLVRQNLERCPPHLLQQHINEPFLKRSFRDTWASRDMHGTALQIAVARHYLDVVQLLLDKGAKVNPIRGKSPLHEAVRFCPVEMVEMLLRHDADIRMRDPEGYTLLYLAVSEGRTEVVKLLLTYGADWYDENEKIKGMAEFAAQANHPVIPKLLDHYSTVPVEAREAATVALENEAWWQHYTIEDDGAQHRWAFDDDFSDSTARHEVRTSPRVALRQWVDDASSDSTSGREIRSLPRVAVGGWAHEGLMLALQVMREIFSDAEMELEAKHKSKIDLSAWVAESATRILTLRRSKSEGDLRTRPVLSKPATYTPTRRSNSERTLQIQPILSRASSRRDVTMGASMDCPIPP